MNRPASPASPGPHASTAFTSSVGADAVVRPIVADGARAAGGAAAIPGAEVAAAAALAPPVGVAARPPAAVVAADTAPRERPSNYPAMLAEKLAGRIKRPLGDLFGLVNFGVNLTTLPPGAMSSLRHAHERQDEFVFVVAGHPTLVTDDGAFELGPGHCAGFRAGTGRAHHFVNRGAVDAVLLEVGDRTMPDAASYPDDDLAARQVDGRWVFSRKDGTPI